MFWFFESLKSAAGERTSDLFGIYYFEFVWSLSLVNWDFISGYSIPG
jgi:hypothetical protein